MIISIIPAVHKVIGITLSEDPLFSVNTLLKHLLASPKEHLFKNYDQFHAAYAFSWLVIVNWYAHISCSCVSVMPIFNVPEYLVCPYFMFQCISLFDRLKALDLVTMKKLDNKVNIIPIIAKADTITKAELQKFKAKVNTQTPLQAHSFYLLQVSTLQPFYTSVVDVCFCI